MLHFIIMQNNLRKMRKAAGLTQAQLAEKLDVTQNYVSAIENGKQSLNLKRVNQLSHLLNCTEPEIWGYDVAGTPIPIIDWVSAGTFLSSDTHNGSSQDNLGTLLYDGRPNGKFALQVQGASMDRMAPEGAYIIVDGTESDLVDGKPYVFCNVSTGETTFKLYRNHPIRLEPYSTQSGYEPIKITSPRNNDEWQVIGRVIEVRTQLL